MPDGLAVSANGTHDLAILDVNELPLEALIDHRRSALDEALSQVVRRLDRPAEHYAAHSSSV